MTVWIEKNLDRLDVLLQHQHKSASDLYLDKLTTVLKSGIYQIDSSGVKMDSKREGERLLKTVEGVMAQEIDTSKTKIVDFAVPKLKADLRFTKVDRKEGSSQEVWLQNEDAHKDSLNS